MAPGECVGRSRAHLKHRTVILFGSTGRVGRAVAAAMTKMGWSVEAVSWLDPTTRSARDWPQILAQLTALPGDADIIFASGVTDPSVSSSDLALANVERPARLIQDTIDRKQ